MCTNHKNYLFRVIPSQVLFLFVLLVVLSIACNLPLMAKQEALPGFVDTSVAETMIAFEGDQPPAMDDQSGGSDDAEPATLTFTPEITDTPSQTPTPTATSTPEVAMVYVSANTNCRTGQGTEFTWLTTLQGGDEAEAVGVDTSGDYWYIRRPDQPSSFCWLWGKYATPSGPYASLPVYTPIPTPTPGFDFNITYHSFVGSCAWYWVLQYRIDNIGGFTLESWRTMSTDHTGGSDPFENIQDKFYDVTGCIPSGQQVDLTPGEAYYINALFDNNPTGHDITVKVKICTKDGLGGECLTKNIRHTP
jgi:hypothetical protein